MGLFIKKEGNKVSYYFVDIANYIMPIVIVLGLLATVIGTKVITTVEEIKIQSAKSEIRSFQKAVDTFFTYCKRYPTSEEGLKILTSTQQAMLQKCPAFPANQIIKEISLDPWGNQYLYELKGLNNYIIRTIGPDGESGNEDYR